MMECIEQERKKVLESLHGATGLFILEVLRTMSSMAEGIIYGLTDERIVGNGTRARCMEKGVSSFQTAATITENTKTT
jgi:hypothetical protein